jgi:hypothetical protein
MLFSLFFIFPIIPSHPANETGPKGAPGGTICCQNVCTGDQSTEKPEKWKEKAA